jgi:hypothetical protein
MFISDHQDANPSLASMSGVTVEDLHPKISFG